jgi:hypothetical protein
VTTIEQLLRDSKGTMDENTHRDLLEEKLRQRMAEKQVEPWELSRYFAMLAGVGAILLVLAAQPADTYRRMEAAYDELQLRRPDARVEYSAVIHSPDKPSRKSTYSSADLMEQRRTIQMLDRNL